MHEGGALADDSRMDFRDEVVRRALDETVGPYRPERSPRARIRRIALIAVLALVAFAAFWTVVYYSSPRHKGNAVERKPIAVDLLPAPAKR